MIVTKYYIEDLTTGRVVTNTGTWIQYTTGCDAKSFEADTDAISFIDTLTTGEYRIFSRIVKS